MTRADDSRTRSSLLEQLRSLSNDRAWLEFVDCYEPRIRRWCLQRGVRAGDLDDVTQTILLRLAQKLPSFHYDRTRSFRAWLRTMTNHEVNRFWRQRERAQRDGSPTEGGLDEVSSDDLGPDELAALRDELVCFERACEAVRARVNPSTWKAFEQTALEGRPGSEVAQALGLTVTAVHRARANVTAMLKEVAGRVPRENTGEERP